jgi:hypothetical protein
LSPFRATKRRFAPGRGLNGATDRWTIKTIFSFQAVEFRSQA